MAIPEGYRLLTSEDVGKVFGVDLESTVYFDTSVMHNEYSSYEGMTNLLYVNANDVEDFLVYIVDISNTLIYRVYDYDDMTWIIDSYTYTSQVEITSFSSSWTNDWLYVKDIATDPYNITLTKPKLTVKCADMTMEKDLVVQAEVYDGTVEGGEAGSGTVAEPPYTVTITINGGYKYRSTTLYPDISNIVSNSSTGYFEEQTITFKHYGVFGLHFSGHIPSVTSSSGMYTGNILGYLVNGIYTFFQTESSATLVINVTASGSGD